MLPYATLLTDDGIIGALWILPRGAGVRVLLGDTLYSGPSFSAAVGARLANYPTVNIYFLDTLGESNHDLQ